MNLLRTILLYLSAFLFADTCLAQSINKSFSEIYPPETTAHDSITRVQIRHINITGNKKTKQYIILREIQFNEGDSIKIDRLLNEVVKARQQVYNTKMFYEVKMEPYVVSDGQIDINVDVKERWYIYPMPQFQPVDRNINEWLVKYKGDLDRVNYGIKFQHFNLSGRRDQLRVSILNGYTRLLAFSYTQPNSNRKLTEGFSIGGIFSKSREIIYKTSSNNKTVFYNNGNFSSQIIGGSAVYIIRKAIKNRHLIGFGFFNMKVDPVVTTSLYNPGYFNNAGANQNIVDFSYSYQHTDVNNVAYPLTGITYYAGATKRGLQFTGGTNMFAVDGAFNRYWNLKKNRYAAIQLYGKVKMPFDLAYINQRALGYGDNFLRGLQYYVVDGVAFGYVKSTVKKKILSFSVPFPIRSKTHKSIPFTFFATTFADAGYVYTKPEYQTALSNRFLYTGGAGIDLVTFYDINMRFEYCFNQLGQNGLFLQARSGF